MSNPRVSVVIPCYNNASVLTKVLPALRSQTVPQNEFEVTVVDDGSTDGIGDVFVSLALPESFRYIRQSNQGAAVARNRGAALARGDVLVFLDSDVIPDSALLYEHLRSHTLQSLALVIGRTRALSAQHFDMFYKILGDDIFAFDQGNEQKPLTYQQVLSRNLSIRRESFFELGGFDEEFPRSGFEDIEFAYRATQLGFRVVYNPKAGGVHHHTGTLAEVGQHMYHYQTSAVLFMKKHPEIKGQIRHLRDKEPIQWEEDDLRLVIRKLARQALSLFPSVWLMRRAISVLEKKRPSRSLLRFLYWQVLGSYLFYGFRNGLKLHKLSF